MDKKILTLPVAAVLVLAVSVSAISFQGTPEDFTTMLNEKCEIIDGSCDVSEITSDQFTTACTWNCVPEPTIPNPPRFFSNIQEYKDYLSGFEGSSQELINELKYACKNVENVPDYRFSYLRQYETATDTRVYCSIYQTSDGRTTSWVTFYIWGIDSTSSTYEYEPHNIYYNYYKNDQLGLVFPLPE